MTPEKHWEWQRLIADAQARIDQAYADATAALMHNNNPLRSDHIKNSWHNQINHLKWQKKQLIKQYHQARLK